MRRPRKATRPAPGLTFGSNPEAAAVSMIESRIVTCPSCWQSIEIELDLSVPEQTYVEDCSVCCRPIVIRYRVDDGELVALETEAESA